MAATAIFITAVGSDSRPGKQHKIFWLPEQGRLQAPARAVGCGDEGELVPQAAR